MTVSSLRETLVATGVEILDADGATELTLREIARRAGVSHGAPRRYFPTHNSLLAAIASHGLRDLADRLDPVLAGKQPARSRLISAAIEYVSFAQERPAMVRVDVSPRPPRGRRQQPPRVFSPTLRRPAIPDRRGRRLRSHHICVEHLDRNPRHRSAGGKSKPRTRRTRPRCAVAGSHRRDGPPSTDSLIYIVNLCNNILRDRTKNSNCTKLLVDLVSNTHRFAKLAGSFASDQYPRAWLRALSLLEEYGEMRISDFARLDRSSQPSATALLRKLGENGYVERRADPEDAGQFEWP